MDKIALWIRIGVDDWTAERAITASNVAFYRTQTKFTRVMFLHLAVSHCVHKGGDVCPSACWIKPHPIPIPLGPEVDIPPAPEDQRQTPPTRTRGRHSPEQTAPRGDTPLCSACWEIRATRGQCASYWNAYLFNRELRLFRF